MACASLEALRENQQLKMLGTCQDSHDLYNTLSQYDQCCAIASLNNPDPEVHRISKDVWSDDMVGDLLQGDVPAVLLSQLSTFGFEAQKNVSDLFIRMLKHDSSSGSQGSFSKYLQSHPQVISQLIQGCGSAEVSLHCGLMLRACARDEHLVPCLFEQDAVSRLLDLTQHQSFEVSSEAFSSLHDLLLSHKAVAVVHLGAHVEDFFGRFKSMLESTSYTVQRQSLKLLGLVLLDSDFQDVMSAYTEDVQFLKVHMNLFLDSSVRIKQDNFHLFKLFVANPWKPDSVCKTLVKNKAGLVRVLKTLYDGVEKSSGFVEDLDCVIHMIQDLV
jgi:calcium binding protein 39